MDLARAVVRAPDVTDAGPFLLRQIGDVTGTPAEELTVLSSMLSARARQRRRCAEAMRDRGILRW
jgi:hypothetical protein